MTTRTNFHCYTCHKGFFGKHNLTESNGHLHCYACIEKLPVVNIPLFDVVYLTKRGLKKETTLRVDSIEEAKEYIMIKKNAKEVVSIAVRQEAVEA